MKKLRSKPSKGSALKPGCRKRVKGQCPLRGQGAELPCGVWGNAPTAPRVTSMLNALNKRRRQRSVPATNFARPQTRPQAAHSTTCTLSRQMGATDQHRETIPVLVFFIAGDFASADATRGLSAHPLDPFGLILFPDSTAPSACAFSLLASAHST